MAKTTWKKTVFKKGCDYIHFERGSFGENNGYTVANPLEATHLDPLLMTEKHLKGWKENGWKLVDLFIELEENNPREIEWKE